MNRKWMLIAGLAAVAIVFLLLWYFAPAIQCWLGDVFFDLLVLLAAFAAGWLLGRFGGKRRRDPDKESARNITRAQQ